MVAQRLAPLALSLSALVLVGSPAQAQPAIGPPLKRVPFPYIAAYGDSASMEPTIRCNVQLGGGCSGNRADVFLQQESGARGIDRGDIIAFRLPRAALPYCDIGGITVKRVLAIGGDRVVERKGLIWLNGRRLLEPYVPAAERGHHSGRWTVPEGSFFVAGDNRAISCDSRYWGFLPRSRIRGKIVEIIRVGKAGMDPVGPPIMHVHFPEDGYVIPTAAMEPTIHCARPGRLCEGHSADLVLEEESGHSGVRRQDIVGFRLPARARSFCGAGMALERVIGLPDERVTERRGIIYVNDQRLVEPYVPRRFRDTRSGSWNVPKRSYFVMADFRSHSCDSRFWGPLPMSSVKGRVVEIFRPPKK